MGRSTVAACASAVRPKLPSPAPASAAAPPVTSLRRRRLVLSSSLMVSPLRTQPLPCVSGVFDTQTAIAQSVAGSGFSPSGAQRSRSSRMLAMPALAQTSSASPLGAPETPMAPTREPADSIGQPPPMATTPGRCRMPDEASPACVTRANDGGVQLEAEGGVGLAGRRGRRMRTGMAVAQHHQRMAGAVGDRHRHLVPVLRAGGQRGLGRLQRGLRRDRANRIGGVLRRSVAAGQHRGQEYRRPEAGRAHWVTSALRAAVL